MSYMFGVVGSCNILVHEAAKENFITDSHYEYDLIERVLEDITYEVGLRIIAGFASTISVCFTAILVVPSLIDYNINLLCNRGLDLFLSLKVNFLFFKAVIIGMASPIGAIILPQIVYKHLEAYKRLCFACAELFSEIVSFEELADLSKLPDNGNRIQNSRASFAEYLGKSFIENNDITVFFKGNDRIKDVFEMFLLEHYTYQELENLNGVENVNIVANFKQNFMNILKFAIKKSRYELIENEIYDGDEIATLDPDAYMAVIDHAILNIVKEIKIEEVEGVESFKVKFNDVYVDVPKNNSVYVKLKNIYSSVVILEDNQLKLLKERLNYKDSIKEIDDSIRGAFELIAGFRVDNLDKIITANAEIRNPYGFIAIFAGASV